MLPRQSLVLTALLILGVGFPMSAAAGTSADVEQVLAQAEASLAQAREAGNSWTSTEQLIAAARQAEDEGEAMELARRALLTADKAREQQQLEQNAWQARVPSS